MYIILHKVYKTIFYLTDDGWGGYKNEITNVVENVWLEKFKYESDFTIFLKAYCVYDQYCEKKKTCADQVIVSFSDGDDSIIELTIIYVGKT